MSTYTAEETRLHHIETMGEPLGCVYSALWQEVAYIHHKWSEFLELFGKKESRINLLNDAAPHFFQIVQDVLWEDIILHIARLTDPEKSMGKKNLSIQAITELISDEDAKILIDSLVEEAKIKASFCRDWRNRHLAHRDLDLSLEKSAIPLEPASRANVKNALEAIVNVLNAVSCHYEESENDFSHGLNHSGAEALLYVIDEGLCAHENRMKRLSNRTPTEDDIKFNMRDV
jgi:hypothetical protein